MIYYDIQHHGDLGRLKWLLGLISTRTNFVNVSLDSSPEYIEDLYQWCRNNVSNCQVVKSLPVTWCGPSQVTQIRNQLERALEVEGWDYYINLSGTCFPTVAQKDIENELLRQKRLGYTSFVYGFHPNKADYWINSEFSTEQQSTKRYKYLRLVLECSDEVVDAFINRGFDPVRNVMHRKGVYCSESSYEKKLFLRGLANWEINDRIRFWSSTKYIVGRTWVILHRKQIEWILNSSLMRELYYQSLFMFEPDENFIPSLVYSDGNPFVDQVNKHNYRYKFGSPSVIFDHNLKDVFSKDVFFGRKLATNVSNLTLNEIQSRVLNECFNK